MLAQLATQFPLHPPSQSELHVFQHAEQDVVPVELLVPGLLPPAGLLEPSDPLLDPLFVPTEPLLEPAVPLFPLAAVWQEPLQLPKHFVEQRPVQEVLQPCELDSFPMLASEVKDVFASFK